MSHFQEDLEVINVIPCHVETILVLVLLPMAAATAASPTSTSVRQLINTTASRPQCCRHILHLHQLLSSPSTLWAFHKFSSPCRKKTIFQSEPPLLRLQAQVLLSAKLSWTQYLSRSRGVEEDHECINCYLVKAIIVHNCEYRFYCIHYLFLLIHP